MIDYDYDSPDFLISSTACKRQGKLFESAMEKGYEMETFVPVFMNSEAAKGLDAVYDHYQWAGNEYILEDVSRRHGLAPVIERFRRKIESGSPYWEACYWMGYTYRFWHWYTGEASEDIYRKADFRKMLAVYPGYHTLSCEMAIDRLKEKA